MTLPAPIYDLTLLLDLEAEEPAREKALADARASIEARGELVRHDDWGERALAYPILKRKSAHYHLLQFHTDDNDLLSGLERTLHITDGVLRFRLIKLRPGVGAPPDMRSGAAPAAPAAPRRSEPDTPAVAGGEPAAVEAPDAAETPASAVAAPAAPDAPAEAEAPAEASTTPAPETPPAEGEAPALEEPAQA